MGRMDTWRAVTAAVSVIVVIAYAVGSGVWVSSDAGWYQGLVRPPWQPPDIVFGLVWPYNFAALIAAGLAVAITGTATVRGVWVAALIGSVIAALGWAYLFYVPHLFVASGISLLIATLLTVPLVLAAWRAQPWAGAILLPYLAWLAVATSLAFGYAARN